MDLQIDFFVVYYNRNNLLNNLIYCKRQKKRMELKIFQKGFNYSQDGQGNRLVYHLQGCNMRCPWCSNPEGMYAENPLCSSKKPLMHYTAEELAREAASCKVMFFDGGGVTFTGGEPTLQFEGLRQALSALKQAKIHTAMECNATHPRLAELFPLIDQLIMDFKHWDGEKHRQITGTGNEIVKENLAKAFAQHKNVIIRTVLVHGINDTAEDAEHFCEFYLQHDTSRARFEFLSYHEYGKEKWEHCGREYTVKNGFVTQEIVQTYERIYREKGLNVVRT